MKYISISFLKHIFLLMSLCSCVYLCFLSFSGTQKNNFPEGRNYIALVLDVSQSMNVKDMGNASRIDIAKQYIRELLSEYAGYNFSLSIFAGESQRVLPFTSDIALVATFLQGLDNNNLTKQGSDIDTAFLDALESFPEDASGNIVFFTDGDESAINISNEVLEKIETKQVSIYILGIGTIQGGYIPTNDSFNPYKTYLGETVVVGLNRDGLKDLSDFLGGKYLENVEHINIHGSNKTDSKRTNLPLAFLYLLSISWFAFFGISIYEIYRK